MTVDISGAKVPHGKAKGKGKAGALHAGMRVKVTGTRHGNKIIATKVREAKKKK